MARFWGCYCGCHTRSNIIRWALIVCCIVGGIVGFAMSISEFHRCGKACPGETRDPARKTRVRNVSVYKCEQFEIDGTGPQYSCSRQTLADRFWMGAFFWVVGGCIAGSMLCCSKGHGPPESPVYHHSPMQLATVHEMPSRERDSASSGAIQSSPGGGRSYSSEYTPVWVPVDNGLRTPPSKPWSGRLVERDAALDEVGDAHMMAADETIKAEDNDVEDVQ